MTVFVFGDAILYFLKFSSVKAMKYLSVEWWSHISQNFPNIFIRGDLNLQMHIWAEFKSSIVLLEQNSRGAIRCTFTCNCGFMLPTLRSYNVFAMVYRCAITTLLQTPVFISWHTSLVKLDGYYKVYLQNFTLFKHISYFLYIIFY